MYKISNSYMTVCINEKGAELSSLVHDDKEYLWNADGKYWARTAPVLFPFVGSVYNGVYRYDGQSYAMGQHGFARDMNFEVVSQADDAIMFRLTDTKGTYEKYPFHFTLYVGYELKDNCLKVIWKVENPDTKELLFSIGGHPAFMCPIDGKGKQTDYYLELKKDGKAVNEVKVGILDSGVLSEESFCWKSSDGIAPITEDMFDRDALIIEEKQLDEVSLLDMNKNAYVTVKFDTPLMGIWSPTKKQAPFVCIEPWYGRCDRAGFDGELKDREYGMALKEGETFQGGFEVIIP